MNGRWLTHVAWMIAALSLLRSVLQAVAAPPPAVVDDLRVANVQDSGFTVLWRTATSQRSAVRYGPSPSQLTWRAEDVRGAAYEGTTHYVQLVGLQPATTYFFRPTTDGASGPSGGPSGATSGATGGARGVWRQVTGPTVAIGGSQTVYGRVLAGGQPAAGTVVTVTLVGPSGLAAPLAGLVEPSGYWQANLGNARSADLGRRLTAAPNDPVAVQAINGAGAVRWTATAGALANGLDLTLGPAPAVALSGAVVPRAAWVPAAAAPVVVTLYRAGEALVPGAQVASWEVRAGAGGQFAVDLLGIEAGAYDLVVKRAGALAVERRGQQVPAAALSFEPVTLGDVDGDDAITWDDVLILIEQFSRRQGQPGFDGRPDLDGDGTVTIFDFSLLAAAYGRSGPLRGPAG